MAPRHPHGGATREPHPGAQLTFSDVDGHRYQLFITDHPQDDVAFLEALYRGRGRRERRICDAKDTGLENLPSASFAINEAWLVLVLIASDLLAWMRGPCLEGALQKAEPKRQATRCCIVRGSSCARRAGPPCASRRLAVGRRPRRRLRSTARVDAGDDLKARSSSSKRSTRPRRDPHAPERVQRRSWRHRTQRVDSRLTARGRHSTGSVLRRVIGDLRCFGGELLKGPG